MGLLDNLLKGVEIIDGLVKGYQKVDNLVKSYNEDLSRQFFTAIMTGNQEEIIECLGNGADVNSLGGDVMSPLCAACMVGRADIVLFLLEKGAKVNSPSDNGFTPLMAACNAGSQEMKTMLLTEYDTSGHEDLVESVLSASNKDHSDLVKLLIEKGADVNAREDTVHGTALMAACEASNLNVIRLLLNHGADVNAVRTDGWTALHIACQKGPVSTVKLLTARRADVNARTKAGITPLMLTCAVINMKSLVEMAGEGWGGGLDERLQRVGVNPGALRVDGNFIEQNRQRANSAVEQAKLLIDSGADVNACTDQGWTALMFATASGIPELIMQLLIHEADAQAIAMDGTSALSIALELGFQNIAQLLVAETM